MATQFKKYSQFYDLIYQDKDYIKEANYIDRIIHKNTTIRPKNILSLGCGTGSYELLFAKKGYQIDGVDLSSQMLALAKKKISHSKLSSKISLHQGDIRKIALNKQFDIVVMLFNIAGYMLENRDFTDCLLNVSKHLKSGGLFLFDCFHAPIVLRDHIPYQIKETNHGGSKIIRLTKSKLIWDTNVVDINFRVLNIRGTKTISDINERHPIRYFSLPELDNFLTNAGFERLFTYDWLETSPEVRNKRDILTVARKI